MSEIGINTAGRAGIGRQNRMIPTTLTLGEDPYDRIRAEFGHFARTCEAWRQRHAGQSLLDGFPVARQPETVNGRVSSWTGARAGSGRSSEWYPPRRR